MKSKFIIGLILFVSAIISQAQKIDTFIPINWTIKTHSFILPELQVDSVFIESLNTVLFDKNDRYMNSITSNPREKSWRHFYIRFEKKDSLNYCIEVSLWNTPSENSKGFFEYNGFFYWFVNDTPPDIILKTKSNKRFSYKKYPPATIDPSLWSLMYNSKTGKIEMKDK